MPVVGMGVKGGQGGGAAGMSWSLTWAKYESSSSSSSHSVPLPGDYVAGDLLMLFVTGERFSGGTPSTPSGWTQLTSGEEGNIKQRIYYKTASGSEGASVSVGFSSSVDCAAVATRMRGHSGNPVAGSPANSANPSNLDRTTVARRLWIAFLSARNPVGDGSFIPAFPEFWGQSSQIMFAASAVEDDCVALVAGVESTVSAYNFGAFTPFTPASHNTVTTAVAIDIL